jgi:uncharacterized protein (DUF885 family)
MPFLLALIFLFGATAPASNIDDVLHDYTIGFLQRNPAVNTYLGGAGLDPKLADGDGRLRDDSEAALAKEDAWLRGVEKSLAAFDGAKLTTRQRIDRDVALAQIRFQLHLHGVRKNQQRSVDTYTDEPFRAVDFQLQGMTATGPTTYGTAAEWTLLAKRLQDVPRFLATAEDQIRAGVAANNTADFRMLFRNGITTSDDDARYFESTLPKLAETRITGADREALLASVRAGSAKAAAAYHHFRDFIAATFFDDATKESGIKQKFGGDRFAIGEAEYDWALKNNLRVTQTAEQLYDASWPIIDQTQRDLIVYVRKMSYIHGWEEAGSGPANVRLVMDRFGLDHPKDDAELIDWHRDAIVRLVQYGRKTKLFDDIPATYELEVQETPTTLRAAIDRAAYDPAPPFKTTGVGRYYLTTTGNVLEALKENNRSAITDLAAHEGFPGLDWYAKAMRAEKPSVVRWLTPGEVRGSSSMWEDSMASDGWAYYAESLLSEPRPDAPDGFFSESERIYQMQAKLTHDVSVRLDAALHTGRMTYDQAVSFYSQTIDFQPGSCTDHKYTSYAIKAASCKTADAAVFRFTKWPTQALTYRLGKNEISALRDEASKKLGDKFDLNRFHQLLIRQGSIPSAYFRDELLRQISAQGAGRGAQP